MKANYFFISVLCIFSIVTNSFSQKTSALDSIYIDSINAVAMRNVFKDQEKSQLHSRLGARLSIEKLYKRGEVKSTFIQGIVHDIRGDYDSSGHFFLKGYQLAKAYQIEDLEADGLNNLGMMNWNKGQFEEALIYFLDALRLYESLNNSKGISKAVSNIGLIYQELELPQEALKYNKRSLAIRIRQENIDGIARSYNNIGICFKQLAQLDSALFYYNKGLEYCSKGDIEQVESSILDNVGNIYQLQNKIDLSIETYARAIKLAEGRASLGWLAPHANLASLYIKKQNYQLALLHAKKADSVASLTRSMGHALDTYRALTLAYGHFGQTELSIEYFDKWNAIKDSIFSENTANAVAEMSTKYESEKKEQQLQLLETQSQLQKAEIQRTRLFIFLALILVTLVVGGLMILNSRKRYKLKASLASEREELQRTRFKAVVDAEEKERKRIAQELHDGLGQVLSTARITVSALDNSNKKVKNSLDLIDHAVKEVRSISHNMMPNALMKSNLEAALRDLLDTINESEKIRATYHQSCELQLDQSVSINLYRVVQEVLNNALKYAKSSEIHVSVSEHNSHYDMEIKDNGVGFDTSLIKTSHGIGWKNIATRLQLINGTLKVHSDIGGTCVKLKIPKLKLA